MKRIIIAQFNKTTLCQSLKKDIEQTTDLICRIHNYDITIPNMDNCDVSICEYSHSSKTPTTVYERDIYDGVFIYSDGIYEHDNKLISDWVGTPHLRIITKTNTQYNYLKEHIYHLLGFPQSYETERKFLISYPDTVMLEKLPYCKKINITQLYLNPDKDGKKMRIRKRGDDSGYIYVKTEKIHISDIKRVENECYISESEYNKLSKLKDSELNAIIKNRYCLMYNDSYFEIDVFPFWKKQAYLECELLHENDKIVFPNFINIISEVTFDKNYTNRSLAKHVPQEQP